MNASSFTPPNWLESPRLWLFTPSVEVVHASLRRDELSAGINAAPGDQAELVRLEVAADWPPMHWDAGPIEWITAKMLHQPTEPLWSPWLIVQKANSAEPEPSAHTRAQGLVIGTLGFKGPPDESGFIEVGYSIVTSQWRRGFASEAVAALLKCARLDPRVRGFRAHTLANDPASGGVLRKNGFTLTASIHDPDDGHIDRFERA
jgi:[ribosomal protein S5]-alanine N-acetyltransferase